MKKILFKGVGTAIATPFDANDNIHFDEFKRLVEFQIDQGVNAIIVCGTTGEAATMTKEEKQELIRYCVKCRRIAGRNTLLQQNNTRWASSSLSDDC